MDHTNTEEALLVGLSCGAGYGVLLAAEHPERVSALAAIAPSLGLVPGHPERAVCARFEEELDSHAGWAKHNRHHMRRDYEGFLRFFAAQMFTEPHSTRQIEDAVGVGSWRPIRRRSPMPTRRSSCAASVQEICSRGCAARSSCSTATATRCDRSPRAPRLARAVGAPLITLEGSGHMPHARKPVPVNTALRELVDQVAERPRPDRTARRPNNGKRALFVSSPIGLGHARRDVAIAQELRALVPGPAGRLAGPGPGHARARGGGRARAPDEPPPGERVEPHRVRVRRARPALLPGLAADGRDPVANYMVFHDLVREERYDLWIGDEAWEIDYYLHEHPSREARPLRLADRLRRLAADGGRRRRTRRS